MARVSTLGAVALGALVAACSWARFDDVSQDAPVLLLVKPENVGFGFGASLASGEVDGFYRVFVGAAPGRTGGAEFELGTGQGASKDAARGGHCGVGCALGKSAAPLQRALLEGVERTLCFAEGIGTAEGAKPSGIQIQCDAGDAAYLSVLDLPPTVQVPEPGKQLSLSSEDGDFPILMAGATGLDGKPGAAWFYPSKSQAATLLDPGVAFGDTYGASVAVVSAGGQKRLAVGEPAQGRVFLFDEAGAVVGCLAQPNTGFGRTLAAGKVDGDGDEELLVASDTKVHVLGGTFVGALASPACGPLGAGAELVALACRTTADLDGCGGSQFGASLGVADIDRDGDGEVLVGAPGMDVRDESDGGAVFVFDVEPAHPDWMLEARFLSSAEAGDRLGAALSVVHQPDRDIFVAGAPGGGKAAVFFCSKLLPAGKRGARCE
jgi:hypothetical protein